MPPLLATITTDHIHPPHTVDCLNNPKYQKTRNNIKNSAGINPAAKLRRASAPYPQWSSLQQQNMQNGSCRRPFTLIRILQSAAKWAAYSLSAAQTTETILKNSVISHYKIKTIPRHIQSEVPYHNKICRTEAVDVRSLRFKFCKARRNEQHAEVQLKILKESANTPWRSQKDANSSMKPRQEGGSVSVSDEGGHSDGAFRNVRMGDVGTTLNEKFGIRRVLTETVNCGNDSLSFRRLPTVVGESQNGHRSLDRWIDAALNSTVFDIGVSAWDSSGKRSVWFSYPCVEHLLYKILCLEDMTFFILSWLGYLVLSFSFVSKKLKINNSIHFFYTYKIIKLKTYYVIFLYLKNI